MLGLGYLFGCETFPRDGMGWGGMGWDGMGLGLGLRLVPRVQHIYVILEAIHIRDDLQIYGVEFEIKGRYKCRG